MGELVEFRRFVMTLRRERERRGLSLADVAERAKVDKAALSRLENGQQLNPTVNTLTRYVRALGMALMWGMFEDGDIRVTWASTKDNPLGFIVGRPARRRASEKEKKATQ